MSKLCQRPAGMPETYGKVACIKAYRAITGQGLLESKNAVEAVESGKTVKIPVTINVSNYVEEIATLHTNGMIITGEDTKVNFIIHSMKANAKMAIDADEHELAIVILDAIKRYREDCQ